MYKNNSGVTSEMKGSRYYMDLCLTENLVLENSLLFLY